MVHLRYFVAPRGCILYPLHSPSPWLKFYKFKPTFSQICSNELNIFWLWDVSICYWRSLIFRWGFFWLLLRKTFGSFFDLVKYWWQVTRPWMTQTFYFPSRAAFFFLFFCPLPVWFSTVKRSLLTIPDLHPLPGRCEVYQNSLLGEMLASNGGRALVFVEGGNATKTVELGFLWTGLGSEVKGKHTLDWNSLILEPQ